MRPPSDARPERARAAGRWVVLGCLALALGPADRALAAMRLDVGVGRTGAVATEPKDLNAAYADVAEPPPGYSVDWKELSTKGGWSLRVALLQPVGERFAVGPELFADDLANIVAALKSSDGEVATAAPYYHRGTLGAGWRVDADLWPLPEWKAWRIPSSVLVATGTAGLWHVAIDRVQEPLAAGDGFGWSLGAAWRFRLPGQTTAGPSFRYARVFHDEVGRYVSGSLDWTWR